MPWTVLTWEQTYTGTDAGTSTLLSSHSAFLTAHYTPSPMLSPQPHFSCISLTGVTQHFGRFLIRAPAASAKWTQKGNVSGTQKRDKPVRLRLSQAVLIARQPPSQTASLCSGLTAGDYVKVWEKGNFISRFSQRTSPASAELWFRTFLSQTWYHCILRCFSFRNLPDFLSPLTQYHPQHPIALCSHPNTCWAKNTFCRFNKRDPWLVSTEVLRLFSSRCPETFSLLVWGSPRSLPLIAPASLFRCSPSDRLWQRAAGCRRGEPSPRPAREPVRWGRSSAESPWQELLISSICSTRGRGSPSGQEMGRQTAF